MGFSEPRNPITLTIMDRTDFDLAVYLVTDSGMLPPGVTFLEQVERAIQGGVTCVQLREKHIETKDFVERALAVKRLTDKAGIPLLINDRLDVALAVGAGLHVGQDDLDAAAARKMLGEDRILGVSVSSVEEAEKAIADGADYVGIQVCFDTQTKITGKVPMGPRGAQPILEAIYKKGSQMKTCLIGGINQSNVARVRFLSGIRQRSLDGVAVVSCIMARPDAVQAAREMVSGWRAQPYWCKAIRNLAADTDFAHRVRDSHPVVHHITNNVAKNFNANATLAVGASPVMSEAVEEFEDFASFASALVLNIGEVPPLEVCTAAVHAYNKHDTPIVFDPVGAPASTLRKTLTKMILVEGYMTVIKGNQDEILAIAGETLSGSGGVDSISKVDQEHMVEVAKRVALSTRSVVVVTGKVDIVADGIFGGEMDLTDANVACQRVAQIEGGSSMMGMITGTGCSLGSVIASFVGATRGDPFWATAAACELYKEAGHIAGALAQHKGPGSFQYLFLDALYQLSSGKEGGEF